MKQRTFIISIISVLLFLCLPTIAMAQDVIVKKDGGVIQSKVLKVTSSEVEYKKFSNQNGPIYTIKVSELISINYENGEIDKFGEAKAEETHVETVTPQTTFNQNPQQQYNDAELLRMYKYGGLDMDKGIRNAKRMKTIGVTCGSVILAGGIFLIILGDQWGVGDGNDGTPLFYSGIGLSCAGIACGTIFYCKGQSKLREYKRVQSTSLYQQKLSFGRQTNLTADVNVLSDNFTNQKTLGLGFHLNF